MNKKFTFIVVISSISIIVIISVVSLLLTTNPTPQVNYQPPPTTIANEQAPQTANVKNTSEITNNISNKEQAEKYISEIKQLINQTHYKKAAEELKLAIKIQSENEELLKLQDLLDSLQNDMVIYKGPIYHVFFHSLIVYPELCFTGDSMEQGYNNWMTTVKEFKLMIQDMYDRGYTLVDLGALFSAGASGKMEVKKLYLPKGQKPLVISVDDMSYYKYMQKDGFAKRLIIDANEKLASIIDTPEGKEIISIDGDVVPILNNFVEQNPDFSTKGAKGTLALTGYEGILGYRTNRDNPSWEDEREKVIPVVNKLKETGWTFASHSYTHRRTFSEGTIKLDFLMYDTQRWKREVGSIVGPTSIYISPFGATFKQSDKRMKYIINQGFDIYCGVGPKPSIITYKDNVYMERIDLDGYKMYHMPQLMKDLFDVSKVFDSSRPKFK